MSLLEDALRRQNETVRRDRPLPPASRPSPVPPAVANPSPPTESTSEPAHPGQPRDLQPAPPPTAFGARSFPALVPILLPAIVLLLVLVVVWLALKQWRPDGPAKGGNPVVAAASPSVAPSTPAGLVARQTPPAPSAAVPQADPVATNVRVVVPSPPSAVETQRVEAVASSAAPADAGLPPSPEVRRWPRFTVKGIAYGSEQIVMLDTGEMLAAGDRSKTGVRVVRVAQQCAWFSWQGETNSLRKGESSDKPLQE